MNIPLCIPDVGADELKLVKEVLDSGWLAHGPKTREFEKNFAGYIGTKHAVSLNSCTSALHLAIQAQNIKGEVIVPSFTFVASANSIITSGAKPVFADIEYGSCNIDPEKIREAITKKTEAIMPVHFAGQSSKMDEIMEISEEHDLKVIEDSAETLGSTFNNKKTGSFGTGCFSFYPVKNMTTGEGGMLTTDDDKFAETVKTLRAHGIPTTTFDREKKTRPWQRAATCAGYNFRMCDILAAIGIVQLKKLDKMNEMRRKHAKYLNKRLDFAEIDKPEETKKAKHVYQMYTIKVNNIDRTEFVLKLRKKGIGASVHFDPPVHLQPYYMNLGYKKGDFPVTEKVSANIVTLPMYTKLKKEQLDYIIKGIEEVLKDAR